MSTGLAQYIRRQMDWEQRLAVEGFPYTTIVSFSGTLSGTSQSLGGASLAGLTRAMWLDSIVLSANKNVVLQVSWSSSAIGGTGYTSYLEAVVGPGQPFSIPIRRLLRPTAYTNAAAFGVTSRVLIDADGTNAQVRGSFLGYSLTDDLNYAADKVMLWFGDSITGPGTGITKKYNQYDWQLRKYLRDQGINIRMVNQSISGTTSGDFDTLRQQGYLDHPQVDLVCYSLMMNDGAQSVPTATYQANLQAAITWKQQRYPNAKMIVFGGTPAENNTTETNAAAMRTAAQSVVSAANDPTVMYINLGSAFDRTQGTTVYASSDPAGSRIHPNDTGHAAVFAVIKTALDAAPTFRP